MHKSFWAKREGTAKTKIDIKMALRVRFWSSNRPKHGFYVCLIQWNRKKMDLERKKLAYLTPPLKRSKPRTQRYEIFVARRGFEKKNFFQIGPQRYQNDRKSIGNNIGGGFGPQKSAWTKLWAEKGSKRVIFRVLGPKKGRHRSKIFVPAQFPCFGGKIFEKFFHKKN